MEGYRYSHRLRVRYSEIDGQNIVFNAHYMTYLDVAITEYYREGLQFDLTKLAEKGLFDFVLAKSTVEYKQPAILHDELDIWCRTAHIGRTSIRSEFVITRADETEPLIEAEIIYVSVHPETGVPQPVPQFARDSMQNYEKVTF